MKKQKLSVGADASTVYTDSVRSKASTEIMHVCPKHQRNTQKGITLIALIITIIVLLILAVVSIRLVINNGILGKAETATTAYGTEEEQEQIKIGYADYQMAQASGEANPKLTVAGANVTGNGPWSVEFSKTGNVYSVSADGKTITAINKSEGPITDVKTNTIVKTNTVLSDTENTELKDEYGNKIVLPAGFKIKVDEDTNNATHVTEGIVVTDGTNEFVWIPVGNIKTSTTDTTGTQITLGRYSDFTVGATPVQTIANYSKRVTIGGHTEDTSTNHDSSLGNAIAKDIYAFLSSANNNGGYYLGRYEAREKGNTSTNRTYSSSQIADVVCNKDNIVYNYITQPNASERCKGMYTNKPFTSDLVNSYAWDTAIMFIENFGGNDTYASKTSINTYGDDGLANKGTSSDKISNIYDMASNCCELSTEYSNYFSSREEEEWPCTVRGGVYCFSTYYTSVRGSRCEDDISDYDSFRPLLYV